MSITSFYFLCFYAVLLLLYYILPRRSQWVLLLAGSILFFVLSGDPVLLVYPAAGVTVTYLCARFMYRRSRDGNGTPVYVRASVKRCRTALVIAVLSDVGFLFALKYVNFFINTVNGICLFTGHAAAAGNVSFLVPLGISYYSLSLISYVTDVYFETAAMQANPFKLALYGMYFPAMVSGPIMRYWTDGEQFFVPHEFDYARVTRGMQRMIWGFMQKLVISERLGRVVDTVYGSYTSYPGAYIWLGTACFAFQLYTDFAGCMDIVLGISETFGLTLPENFDRPFFSQTVAEYWRRWHISLGVWMKEYVFYPLLRSGLFTKQAGRLRARFGRKAGKQLNTFLAMLILWFTVGIWHGGDWKYVIGSGLLHWCYIVVGEIADPRFRRLWKKLGIDPDIWWLRSLRIIRTFFLVNIGFVFFRGRSVADAWDMLKLGVSVWNPGVLCGSGMLGLGLEFKDIVVTAVSLGMFILVAVLKNKGSVRERIARCPLPVRWIIWYALLFYVILLGCYGPGYSAAQFIYQGF